MHRNSPEVRRHPDSEGGIVRRRDRLFRLLMLGAAVEAAVAIPSIISMGPENGTILMIVLNAVLCFPYSIVLALTMPETQQTDLFAASVLLLAIFQFPAYALLGWLLKRIRPRWNGWNVLAVIHGVALVAVVVAAFEFILSHFQT
jgi:hypothetical protein